MGEVAFPSSGDAAKDRERAERFLRNDRLIKAGKCPNGCGPMARRSASKMECESCGFVHVRRRVDSSGF